MIVNFAELGAVRSAHPHESIVFAGGCFDLVHQGHVDALARRKAEGDLLVVGLSSDARIVERKGPTRPIINQAGRIAVIDAMRFVDYSFIMPMPMEGMSPTMQVLDVLRPNIFVDHEENEERWRELESKINSFGTELRIDHGPKLDSSSAIIRRVQAATSTLA